MHKNPHKNIEDEELSNNSTPTQRLDEREELNNNSNAKTNDDDKNSAASSKTGSVWLKISVIQKTNGLSNELKRK